MEKDVFTITFICKLSMVKRGIYGCQVVKGWTVVVLFCVNLAKLEPFLRITFTVSLATTEICVRLGRWKRGNSQFSHTEGWHRARHVAAHVCSY